MTAFVSCKRWWLLPSTYTLLFYYTHGCFPNCMFDKKIKRLLFCSKLQLPKLAPSYLQLKMWAPSPAAENVSSNLQLLTWAPTLQPPTCSCSLELPRELQPSAAHVNSNHAASHGSSNLQLPMRAPTCSCSRELQPAAAYVSFNL